MTDTTRARDIPIQDVSPRPPAHPAEVPYQLFLATALLLALSGGFMLAVALPVAAALEWNWGARWQELVQAHGQLQVLGFAGLFISGMAVRMMPRFSGRPLAYPLLARGVVPLIGGGVALRALSPLVSADAVHGTFWIVAAALLLAGSISFAAVILRTLLHPASKAEATGWFFALGAAALAAAGTLNLVLTMRAVDDGVRLLPAAENNALLSIEISGFLLMFVGGVATRAVATLVGHPRSQSIARLAAVALAAGTAAHAGTILTAASRGASANMDRVGNVALVVVALSLLLVVWATGIFHPRANRVAAASQDQFWFVRAALAWLVVSALLLGWYAAGALTNSEPLDQFELDAVRHALTVGVVTMMILGMAMLVVPEFAGRRLLHPHERWLTRSMLLALNAGVALRIWPALSGVDWLTADRYWPMAAAGVLATAVVAAFALMFGQSYLEQRKPGWATPQALARRPAGKR